MFPLLLPATYHMKYGPVLESTSWRTITSPALYNSTNTTSHQAQSENEMPMAIDKLDSFEKFEHVNVNVFRYLKKTTLASWIIHEKIRSGP